MERHSHMPKWKVTFRDELKKSSVLCSRTKAVYLYHLVECKNAQHGEREKQMIEWVGTPGIICTVRDCFCFLSAWSVFNYNNLKKRVVILLYLQQDWICV